MSSTVRRSRSGGTSAGSSPMRHGVWSLKRDTSDASAKEMLMLTSLTTVPLTSPTTGKRSIYLQSVSGANLMSLLHLKVDLYLRPFLFDELQSTRARRKESWHRRGQSSEEVC